MVSCAQYAYVVLPSVRLSPGLSVLTSVKLLNQNPSKPGRQLHWEVQMVFVSVKTLFSFSVNFYVNKFT